MKNWRIKAVGLGLICLSIGFFQSCKNKDPSILKVYTRSVDNELLKDVKVIIIGDVNSDPPTTAYVDTLITNESGFAQFNMDDYFTKAGEDNPVGYFDIIIKKDNKQGTGRVRCRAHITAVETVTLQN